MDNQFYNGGFLIGFSLVIMIRDVMRPQFVQAHDQRLLVCTLRVLKNYLAVTRSHRGNYDLEIRTY